MVKCQTIGEHDKLNSKTIQTCLATHFQRELKFFKPKVIVTLGNEVHKALLKIDLKIPTIRLKHPSYYYRKEVEWEVLKELKQEIKNFIKPPEIKRAVQY